MYFLKKIIFHFPFKETVAKSLTKRCLSKMSTKIRLLFLFHLILTSDLLEKSYFLFNLFFDVEECYYVAILLKMFIETTNGTYN